MWGLQWSHSPAPGELTVPSSVVAAAVHRSHWACGAALVSPLRLDLLADLLQCGGGLDLVAFAQACHRLLQLALVGRRSGRLFDLGSAGSATSSKLKRSIPQVALVRRARNLSRGRGVGSARSCVSSGTWLRRIAATHSVTH